MLKSLNLKVAIATLLMVALSTIATWGLLPNTAVAACADNSRAAIIKAPSNLPRVGCANNTNALKTVIRLVFGALTMLSVLFIVIGGIKYSLSGGDANGTASAKKTILYAVVGLVLGLSVFVITSYVLRLGA